jgi:ketosteroid isomerase-like protein
MDAVRAIDDARTILANLQAAVDARDVDALASVFDDDAVLIGTSADGRDAEGLRRYVTAVSTQPGSLRWEWEELVPFYQSKGMLGFAAFGEVVLEEGDVVQRAPIRVTIFAVRQANGWRMRQFHGSIPTGV